MKIKVILFLLVLTFLLKGFFGSALAEDEATESAQISSQSADIVIDLVPTLPIQISPALPTGGSAKLRVAAQVRKEIKKGFKGGEKVEVELLNTTANKIEVEVTNNMGEMVNSIVEQDQTDVVNLVKISPPPQFVPGKYKLKMWDNVGFEIEQDFYWGVLAINTNKSIYLPGETAYLQMASLDANGHTICDSNLELTVNNEVLSTENGKIKYSGKCIGDNVTDTPDYFAYYQVGITGVYQMDLKNIDNGFEITDSFEVKDEVPLEIERSGATRINPFKSGYKMTLKVKAKEDFEGTIKEQTPLNFQIIPGTDIKMTNVDEVTEISWDKKMKAGEAVILQYEYKAPKESPKIYVLGPVQITDRGNKLIFSEARQWQIAADATQAYTVGTSIWVSPFTGNVSLELHGGGGGGGGGGGSNKYGGGGGAGGQAVVNPAVAVVKGVGYSYSVGGTGAAGAAAGNGGVGGDTTLEIGTTTYTAKGGYFGRGFSSPPSFGGTGTITGGIAGVGGTVYKGGDGADGLTTLSGGGGGGAGSTADGNNASGITPGGAQTDNGGVGGSGSAANTVAGGDGSAYGGGGGGGTKNKTGGYGYGGYILLTYPDNNPPTVALTSPGTGTTLTDTTPDLVFVGTDSTFVDDIEYNVQVDTAITFDSLGTSTPLISMYSSTAPIVATYYFDASVSGPTDPNSVWTDDTLAFDTSNTSYAYPSARGSSSSNYLEGVGTISPTSGGTITQVRARIGGQAGSIGEYANADILDGSTSLGIVQNTCSTSCWGSYLTLSTPAGGWDWNKVKNLGVRMYESGTGSIGSRFLKVEIEVTSTNADAGFSAGNPFASGVGVTYTVQSALSNNTYYWRVAGIDPLGSNTYGAWSDVGIFVILGGTTPPGGPTMDQVMRHGGWFSNGVRQPFNF